MRRMDRRTFLSRLGMAAGAAAILGPMRGSSRAEKARRGAKKLNFLFILIDDLGWPDVGCFGSSFHQTPNIDRLAAGGMKFTDAYAACPVCSPTRASIVTGKYPARLKLTNYLVGRRRRKDSPVLPAAYAHRMEHKEVTLAEALKKAGYVTGHIGKWHLGPKGFWPEDQGFDVNIGGCQSGMPRSFFWPAWKNNPPITGKRPGEYLPDRLAEEAEKFITNNRDKPFFLYMCHYAVHIPMQAKKAMIEAYRQKIDPKDPQKNPQKNPIYAAMVQSVDESVGRMLKTLDRQGVADRTVVFFMSDNGGLSVREGAHTPATSNHPLRAGKGYLYEGGIREPLIVRWPGAVKRGSTCRVPVTSVDFYPTILDIAGVKGGAVDGVSLTPLLKQTGGLKRDAIYWHYPHFSNQGGRPGAAIRQGDFKLILRYEDGSVELYNLKDDIGEKSNLAAKMPKKAAELRARLEKWLTDVDANMCPPNPDYTGTKVPVTRK